MGRFVYFLVLFKYVYGITRFIHGGCNWAIFFMALCSCSQYFYPYVFTFVIFRTEYMQDVYFYLFVEETLFPLSLLNGSLLLMLNVKCR